MTWRRGKVSRCRSAVVTQALVVTLGYQWLAPVYAQSGGGAARAQGAEGRVENTQVVINGAMVNITYDLVAPRGQSAFAVELEASQDDGRTYTLKPKTVTGDVGTGITAGVGKKIVWEAAKDTDNLQLAQLKFRVRAQAEPTRAAPSSSVTPQSTPRQPQTAPSGATAQPARGGKNSLLWPGVGAIGGGLVLSWLAAAGSLRDEVVDQQCVQDAGRFGFSTDFCSRSLETNTPIVGVGIGIAAAGAALIFVGKRKAAAVAAQLPSIVPLKKGFMVYRSIDF